MSERGAIVLRLAALALFAAASVQVYVEFGDSPFTRIVAGVVLTIFAAGIAWWYVALPLLAWRRGRWPVDAIDLTPVGPDPQWPVAVRQRIEALEALGFTPRLMHTRAEGNATATIVVLAHPARDVYATVSRISLGSAAFINTRMMSRPGTPEMLMLVDAVAPSPFPPRPGTRMLLFPDADAATLLAHFERLHGHRAAEPMSDTAFAAAMARMLQSYDRWLLEAGYVAMSDEANLRRYTLKGGFSAVLRPLWPWHAIDRARRARDGREALRAVSGGAA